MNLAEKYRPKRLEEMAGQAKALDTVRRVLARGWGGRAWWINGPSGSGKTTLARILAELGADPFAVEELMASEVTPARIRQLEASMQLVGWGKGGRAYIVNEAHGMRKDAIRAWLDVLERLPGHVVVIFTTTKAGQEALFEDDPQGDAGPLLSRCVPVGLTTYGAAQAFAERAKSIAEAEGLDGQPVAKYLRLVQECRNNLRAVLQRIEAGEMLAQ